MDTALSVIETPRLTLRKLTQLDTSQLTPILGDIEVMYAWEHAFSSTDIDEWIAKNILRYERDGFSYWACVLKSSGELMGLCGLLKETCALGEYVGVGYIFAKAFWHQGYALEAATGCMEYAKRLGISELTAQIRPSNTASLKVAMSLGMRPRGQFVKEYNGIRMPHVLYGMSLCSLPTL